MTKRSSDPPVGTYTVWPRARRSNRVPWIHPWYWVHVLGEKERLIEINKYRQSRGHHPWSKIWPREDQNRWAGSIDDEIDPTCQAEETSGSSVAVMFAGNGDLEGLPLRFERLWPTAILPRRARYQDAGIDLFTGGEIEVPPRKVTRVLTGIRAQIPVSH